MGVEASGTLSTSGTTEHTLNSASFTADKKYGGYANLKNLTGVDIVRVRVLAKVLSGGAEEGIWEREYCGDQGFEDVQPIGPWYSPYSTKVTVTKLSGSNIDIEWNIFSL